MDFTSTQDNVINLYSFSWKKLFPNNTAGNFTNPLRVPLHFTKPTSYALKFLSMGRGFFNLKKEIEIGVYISKDGETFIKKTMCRISPGFYATLEDLIDNINVSLLAVILYSDITDVPHFEVINNKNHIQFTISTTDIYEPKKVQYKVCLQLPQIFTEELGFRDVSLKSQYDNTTIRSRVVITFPDLDTMVNLHTSLSGNETLKILPVESYISSDEVLKYIPVSKDMLHKDIHEISVWFTEFGSNIKMPKLCGEIFLSMIFED